jgi:DNA polymerase III subunit delta'
MLLGHDEPWRQLRAAMASPRMHHAWILAGPAGLGKGTFARAAAAELVAEPGVKQPEPDAHPDIIVPEHPPKNKAEQDKRAEGKEYEKARNIPVDSIRAMERRLVTRPTLGSRRVVIIDPADDLEKSAANAFLKSLEEPPAGTFFLLVTHRPGRILPTIRSRCRLLRFAPLGSEAIDSVLRDLSPESDAAARAAAIVAADGSPGVALAFLDHKLGAAHGLMCRLIREGDAHFALRGALAEELGSKPSRERQAAVLDLARAVLAGDLADATPQRQLALIEAHAALVRLAAQAPTYNFDPGLLVMEIGGLLASAAMPRETA